MSSLPNVMTILATSGQPCAALVAPACRARLVGRKGVSLRAAWHVLLSHFRGSLLLCCLLGLCKVENIYKLRDGLHAMESALGSLERLCDEVDVHRAKVCCDVAHFQPLLRGRSRRASASSLQRLCSTLLCLQLFPPLAVFCFRRKRTQAKHESTSGTRIRRFTSKSKALPLAS